MLVFKTESGLRYRECAYFIQTDDTDVYLCVDINILDRYSDRYVVGELYDTECMSLEISDYDISDSPLFGTFLFDFYIKHLKVNNDN